MKRDHYRKVFKSDHLSSFDLEDLIEQNIPLIFTIKNVIQETGAIVAGKNINANIVYFHENIKPLVLNATNSKILSKVCKSSFVQDWKDITIELYILKNIKFGRDIVDGIRIKPNEIISLSEGEIKIISSNIDKCNSKEELNNIYNSDIRIKTNLKLRELLNIKIKEL